MPTTAHRVLIGLILVMVAVFALQVASHDDLRSYMMVPVDLQTAGQDILNGESNSGDWKTLITLVTPTFLHGDLGHISANMIFFWVFGGLVGELLGWRWMLAIFFITAIGSSIGDTLLRSGSDIPGLGASGAVMGFEGAYLGLAVRWSLPNPHIWPIAHPIPPLRLALVAAVGFFLDISGAVGPETGTAYGAHLGGFVVGLFLTCFITPRPATN